MAYPIKTPAAPVQKAAPVTPDWVAAYYTPEAAANQPPANQPQVPGLDALEQMYAYYDV
ncbi:MAG: hypothetical protein ACNA7M_06130 [Roseovarius sp.]